MVQHIIMSDMAQDAIKDAVSGFEEEIKIRLAEDEFIAKDPHLSGTGMKRRPT
jgi:hypothetical protein